jgi:hypothetical protein
MMAKVVGSASCVNASGARPQPAADASLHPAEELLLAEVVTVQLALKDQAVGFGNPFNAIACPLKL